MRKHIGEILTTAGAMVTVADLYALLVTGNESAFWLILGGAAVLMGTGICLFW